MIHSLNVVGQVVDLGAVLVRHNWTLGRTRVGAQYNAILVDNTYNGCTSFCRCRWLEAAFQQSSIAKILQVNITKPVNNIAIYSYRLQLSKLKPGAGTSRAVSKYIFN